MASEMQDLCSPVYLQAITALWRVANYQYSDWSQRHMCEKNLIRDFSEEETAAERPTGHFQQRI